MARMWLRVEAVRGAIGRLVDARIHPTFPGYLGVLRTAAAESRTTKLKWDYAEYHKSFFEVAGGPPNKPYYRPMWDVNTTRHRCWLNKNLAGSYAARSNTAGPFRKAVEVEGKGTRARYSLTPDHWEQAFHHLAFGSQLSATDVATFLYRDYCLETDGEVTVGHLVSVFRYEFGLTDEVRETGGAEFDRLFKNDAGVAATTDWLQEAGVSLMTDRTAAPFRRSPLRSADKVRLLNAEALDVVPDDTVGVSDGPSDSEGLESSDERPQSAITTQDTRYRDVEQLLRDGYAGVIFSGPPGTSKSWYAHNIGLLLAGNDPERLRSLQFHPSYQYEDFVEGYVPRRDGSGFRLRRKHLLQMCEVARQAEDELCVIVIDELSRADPGRVFGESLTYIETSKRGRPFQLASGRKVSIPRNLVFLATMNTLDRGVDEIDIAFERRFARIEMLPDEAILKTLLHNKEMAEPLRKKVVEFFNKLQEHPNQYCRIGHAYFGGAATRDDLQRLWEHQLRFTLEKACRLQTDTFKVIEEWWADCVRPPEIADAGAGGI